jgi:pectinesterase
MTVVSGDTVTFEWEDNFVTPVPGPTPTPTPTATATPTPTPTVPPLFEIKSEYYVDGDIGTATNSKRSTLQYLFGPSLIDSTNFNWTTTPFSGSSSTNFVNPFSGVVGINRTAYQRTTFLPNQFLTGFTANILVNGSTVFTTGFTYSPPLEIPPDASADTKIINVSGITFNSNDVVKIQWFDGVNFVQPTPTPTATPTPTPTPTPAPATVQFRSKMVGGTGINKRHTNRIARFTIDNSSFEVIPFESFSTTSGNATVTTPSQNVLTIGSSITIYIERDLCRTTTGTLTRDTTLARVFINGSQVGSTCTTGTNTTVNLCPTVISNQYSTCLGTFTINSGDVIIVEIEDRFVQA